MRASTRLTLGLTAVLAAGVVMTLLAQQQAARSQAPATSGAPADATTRIVAAAQAVLATLDDAGRATVQFPFEGPQKTRWSNLPSPMFERRGLRLADVTEPQRAAVMTLLATALSRDGYQKVLNIMEGDEVLRQGGGGARRWSRRAWRTRRPRWPSVRPRAGTISRSSARPPRRNRGPCSTAVITWRST